MACCISGCELEAGPAQIAIRNTRFPRGWFEYELDVQFCEQHRLQFIIEEQMFVVGAR